MAKAIHAMIRVLDESRAVDFRRTAFGVDDLGAEHARLVASGLARLFFVSGSDGDRIEVLQEQGRYC